MVNQDDYGQSGLERISSAPRLSFSSQDVFNLRNHKLSYLSKSSPGIYNPQNHAFYFKQHQSLYDPAKPTPKSILLNPKETSIAELPIEDENEEKKPFYSFLSELQFTAFVFLFFALVIVTPISMIVIGSIYLHNCPVQAMIPIFLIVGGSTFLFSMGLLKNLHSKAMNSEEDKSCYRRTSTFAIIFQLGWFVAGCYWVYRTFEPDYNEGSTLYCHKVLYMFAFWLLNSIFLCISIFSVLFTIYIFFGRDKTSDGGAKI